jgi:YVTN family beta-propeller protein
MVGRVIQGVLILLAVVIVVGGCLATKNPDQQTMQTGEPAYHSPNHIILSPDGDLAYVVNQTANSVSVIDVEARKVLREIPVGEFPSHIALTPDGGTLLVTCLHTSSIDVVDLAENRVSRTLRTGFEPYGVTASAGGEELYVANALSNTVSIIDLESGKTRFEVPVGRGPRYIAEIPGSGRIIVGNGMSRNASIIDVTTGQVVETRDLGRAGLIRQVIVSPGGRWAFAAHIVSHDELITLQMERGMIHSNGFSVMDLQTPEHRVTLLLDKLLLGAANPWGLAIAPDESMLYVSIAGTHEIAFVDLPRALDVVAGILPEEVDRVSKDVQLLDSLRIMRRIDCGGLGPRGVALNDDRNELLVANHFTNDVAVMDAESGEILGMIPLGPEQPMTLWREGEMLFNDGRLCFQQWFSCASCHQEDATVDGFNWDLANDGLGNPKSAKSMHDVYDTPPAMWRGVRMDIDAAVQAGQRFLGRIPDPEKHKALMAFLANPRLAPNPYRLVDPEVLAQGEVVYYRARCNACHSPPTFSDLRKHDLGFRGKTDLRSRFVTPSLRECYRTGPFLHDGRAETLREIFTDHNPDDLHGLTSHLDEAELDALIDYLRTL